MLCNIYIAKGDQTIAIIILETKLSQPINEQENSFKSQQQFYKPFLATLKALQACYYPTSKCEVVVKLYFILQNYPLAKVASHLYFSQEINCGSKGQLLQTGSKGQLLQTGSKGQLLQTGSKGQLLQIGSPVLL